MRIFGLFLGFLLISISAYAQSTFQPRALDEENKGIVYTKEVAMDLRLQTNGWGIGVTWGTLQGYDRTRYFYANFGELKHPREVRTSGQNFGSRYIFGKQNNLYILRGGLGQKRYISEKAKHKGVAIGWSYKLGGSLGLLKPYYLEIDPVEGLPSSLRKRTIRYSSRTAADFLDKEKITGAAGFGKGWDDLTVTPGVHAMFSTHFDWGAFDEMVKAVEAGIMVDVYFQDVPIMVDLDHFNNLQNRTIFVNLFINLQFGKRS